jgi:hypothetical protein
MYSNEIEQSDSSSLTEGIAPSEIEEVDTKDQDDSNIYFRNKQIEIIKDL